MEDGLKFILIGNYKKDEQESMIRFAQMLNNGLQDSGYQSELWAPVEFFGKPFKSTTQGIAKWFGYLDKFILFPIILSLRVHRKAKKVRLQYHICDHSNSPYLKYLPKDNTAITCHDVLAIRGAMGFANTYCESTGTGKILQNWILKNLLKAKLIAAVSETTLRQLKEFEGAKKVDHDGWKVIHNAFNARFFVMTPDEYKVILAEQGITDVNPFILHVGSAHPRKNRGMLLEMVAVLGDRWKDNIYFAGEAADDSLIKRAEELRLSDRVRYIVKPEHKILVALYNACHAFIFPSYSEGFGWPLIEAQACGAPVIASNLEPMPEVSGGSSLLANPDSPEEFAAALLKLQQDHFRGELIQKGFLNADNYDKKTMVKKYLELHSCKKVGEFAY